jgi:type II secretory pathway component PulJ
MIGKSRRGSSFIEVILSLVLLAIGGTALVTLLGQTSRSIESLRDAEEETRAAGRELSALAVLDRAQLAARVGQSRAHGWSLRVVRPTANLFDVSIAATDTGAALLRTTIYRPDSVASAIP